MSAIHRVTGYDRQTERLERQWDVPADLLSEVRSLAHVPSEDVEAAGSYPFDVDVVPQVAATLRYPMDVDRFDWFLEPFAQ